MTTESHSPTLDSSFSELLSDIPLSKIDADPHNERADTPEDLDDLISSLHNFGLQERVRLYRLSTDRYLIASGHRRVAAAHSLGWSSIAAIVISPPKEEVQHIVSRIASNLCRKDIDPISLAYSLRILRTHYSVPVPEIARWLGKSTNSVSNHLRLLELPTPIQDLLRSRQISVGHALLLLRIQTPEYDWLGDAIATSEECQVRLAKSAVEENLSIRALEVRVRNVLGNNRAIQEWLAKQAHQPTAAQSLSHSTPSAWIASSDPLRMDPDNDDRLVRQRSLAQQVVREALGFEDDIGPTLNHLRLATLMLADTVYFYHSVNNTDLLDHRDIVRAIEKAPNPLAVLNILGKLVNAAIIADLSVDGTDFVGDRRSRWAKSHFNLLPLIHSALQSPDFARKQIPQSLSAPD
jgi:ParB/RepB/Spo0J family partition protein